MTGSAPKNDDLPEISAGAGALVAIEVGLCIIQGLVDRGIMTDADAGELLGQAAERQRHMGECDAPPNREAAVVLDRMAKAYAGKFVRGMPTIRPGE
jgi:hypothetical protein